MGTAGETARLLVWGLLVAAGGSTEELATVTPEVPGPGRPESGAHAEPGIVMWLVPTEGQGQPSVRGERVEGPAGSSISSQVLGIWLAAPGYNSRTLGGLVS